MTKERQTEEGQEDQHRQFKGTLAPPELHDLVESGKLSPSAAWLAMVINAYAKKRGCWMSNETLGKKMHLSGRQAQRLLNELEEVRLLITTFDGDIRLFDIDWTGKSGNKRGDQYKAKTRQKCPVRHDRNVQSDTTEMSNNHKETDNREETDNPARGKKPSCPSAVVTPKGDRRANLNKKTGGAGICTREVSWAALCSRKLRDALARKGRIHPRAGYSEKTWSENFDALAKFAGELTPPSDRKEIENVLNWYCSHLDHQFVPKADSAAGFYDKYIRIRDAKARFEEEERRQNGGPRRPPHDPTGFSCERYLTEDEIC